MLKKTRKKFNLIIHSFHFVFRSLVTLLVRDEHYLVCLCVCSVKLQGEGYTLDMDKILVAWDGEEDPYLGHMQNLYFDHLKIFEYIYPGSPPPGINVNSTVNGTDTPRPLPIYPITYRSLHNTYVGLPTLQVYGDMELQFLFKTRMQNALLFYSEGSGQDFMAMELVNGVPHFIVNDGSGVEIRSLGLGNLHDNRWHVMQVEQVGPHSFDITVDNMKETINLRRTLNRIELVGPLYVGGVPESKVPNMPHYIQSHGFVGCLSTFKVNGQLKNLWRDAISKTTATLSQGCSGKTLFFMVFDTGAFT